MFCRWLYLKKINNFSPFSKMIFLVNICVYHTCIRYGLSVYYFIPKYRVHLYTSECTFWTALFAILQSFDLEHDFGGVVRSRVAALPYTVPNFSMDIPRGLWWIKSKQVCNLGMIHQRIICPCSYSQGAWWCLDYMTKPAIAYT